MKQKLFITLSLILIFSLLLSGCSLLGLNATPTPDPLAQEATVNAAVAQAMQSTSAALTSTAAALPTSTSTATPTLEPTATFTSMPTATVIIPTATKTFVPIVPTKTLTPTPAAYSCRLNSTSPASGTKININTDFDATWKVTNIGTKVWEVGYLDLKYVSGTKMQTKGDIFDIATAVPVGGDLTLVVDMHTPSTAGKYTASWVLTMDGAVMCTLPVNIEAVNP